MLVFPKSACSALQCQKRHYFDEFGANKFVSLRGMGSRSGSIICLPKKCELQAIDQLPKDEPVPNFSPLSLAGA